MKTFKVIRFAILSSTAVLVSSTWAQTSYVAHEKRLAGAAKTSFLKKCEREAIEKCEAAATERKLAGAAKNSNVKKCVKEVVGE
jgi:hypothetical protein